MKSLVSMCKSTRKVLFVFLLVAGLLCAVVGAGAQQNPFLSGGGSSEATEPEGVNSGAVETDAQDTNAGESNAAPVESAPAAKSENVQSVGAAEDGGSDPAGEPSKETKAAPGTSSQPKRPGRFMQLINSFQRDLYGRIASAMQAVKSQDYSGRVLFIALGAAFLYGLLHALGPGHRKTVIFSYFLAEDAPVFQGVAAGILMALLHGGAAVALILPIYYLIKGSLLVTFNSVSRYIEVATFAFIAVFGAVMLIIHLIEMLRGTHSHEHDSSLASSHGYEKKKSGFGMKGADIPVSAATATATAASSFPSDPVTGAEPMDTGDLKAGQDIRNTRGPWDTHDTQNTQDTGMSADLKKLQTSEKAGEMKSGKMKKRQRNLLLLVIGSGLVPCPGAAMVLMFALSMQMTTLGLLAVGAMSLGMAVTISAVAVVTLGARTTLNKTTSKNEKLTTILHNTLELGGYGLIFLFGFVMVLGIM